MDPGSATAFPFVVLRADRTGTGEASEAPTVSLTVGSPAASHQLGSMTTFLTHFHGPTIYLIVAALLIGESGFAIGFFVPGEIAVVLGGVLAREHRVEIVLMLVVAVAAAIVSYLIGYGLGRAILPWVLEHTALGKHPVIQRTRDQLSHRGGPAVLVGRFVAVVRAVMPALAGLSDLRLRTFVLFNIIGGVVWATLYTMLGYGLGTAYQHALRTIGIWTYVAVGVLVVALVAWHLLRSRRRRRQAAGDRTEDERQPS
jgi:membrane-associated protein